LSSVHVRVVPSPFRKFLFLFSTECFCGHAQTGFGRSPSCLPFLTFLPPFMLLDDGLFFFPPAVSPLYLLPARLFWLYCSLFLPPALARPCSSLAVHTFSTLFNVFLQLLFFFALELDYHFLGSSLSYCPVPPTRR